MAKTCLDPAPEVATRDHKEHKESKPFVFYRGWRGYTRIERQGALCSTRRGNGPANVFFQESSHVPACVASPVLVYPASVAKKFTGYFFCHKHLPHLADDTGVSLVERFKQRKQKQVFLRRWHGQPILIIGVVKNFQRTLAHVLSGNLKISIFAYLRGNMDRGFA
jgi:hypothetical protein